jgi:hypothetical protein
MIRPGSRQMCWSGLRDGVPVVDHHEPDTGPWLRGWIRLARKMPFIERFL